MESAEERYTFVTLLKTLGAIYSSVNHTVLAQQELERGLKQGVHESVVFSWRDYKTHSAKPMVLL